MQSIYKNELVEIYDLSITRCNQIILKTNLERNGNYFNYYKRLLHRIQSFRIQAAGLQQTYFDENYCRNSLKLSEERIEKLNFADINSINEEFGNIRGTHVDFDHNCVSFNDSYILDPLKDESEYYQFLCLLLFTVSYPEIKEVLKFHFPKHDNHNKFKIQLLDYFMELPDLEKKSEIKDRIIKWFEEKDIPSKIDLVSSSKIKPTSFKEIFSNEGWEKYIEALQKTNPILINKKYEFVGNRKGHIGVIGSWMSYLKSKGIIKQNIPREQLIIVFNNEIKNLRAGLGGKTIDNYSKLYKNSFENQLINLTN